MSWLDLGTFQSLCSSAYDTSDNAELLLPLLRRLGFMQCLSVCLSLSIFT